MKRFVPLLSAVAALAAIAIVTAVAVGASSGSPGASRQLDEDTGGDVAAMCAPDHPDCDDMMVDGAGSTCLEGAEDCADIPGNSASRCMAPGGPGADPVVIPECNDTLDCTLPEGEPECSEPLPGDPNYAIDPICIDDGTGADCLDTPGNPPSGPVTLYDLTVAFNESVTQIDLEEIGKIVEEISPDSDFLVRESFPPVGVVRVTTDMASFCSDIEAKFESLPYVSDVTCAVASDAPPVSDPDEPVSSEPGEVGSVE